MLGFSVGTAVSAAAVLESVLPFGVGVGSVGFTSFVASVVGSTISSAARLVAVFVLSASDTSASCGFSALSGAAAGVPTVAVLFAAAAATRLSKRLFSTSGLFCSSSLETSWFVALYTLAIYIYIIAKFLYI